MSYEISYPESLPSREEILNFLNFIGHDERKLLLFLTLINTSQYLGALGISGIKAEMDRRAGTTLEGHSRGIKSSLDKSFVKTGIIDTQPVDVVWTIGNGATRTAQVDGYAVNGKANNYIEIAGLLLNWSLEASISLYDILGPASNPANLAKMETRIRILRILAERQEISYLTSANAQSDISKLSPEETAIIESLYERGVIEINKHFVGNRRKFQILDPEYVYSLGRKEFDQLSEESKRLFYFFRSAYQLKPDWEVEEFFAYIHLVSPELSAAEIAKLRGRFANSLRSERPSFSASIRPLPATGTTSGTELVRASVSNLEDLNSLVELLSGFEQGLFGAKGFQFAKEVFDSPELFEKLYKKSFDKSTRAHADTQATKRILSILQEQNSPLTAEQIRSEYNKLSGRSLSLNGIRSIIRELVASDDIESISTLISNVTLNSVNKYRRIYQED